MKIYSVGGAVRDQLMGLVPSDYDYVVVGGTPQAMLDAGFRTVGKDFPVFLHPETQEEYALARTERKSGNGYTGFTVHAAPDVTLEDDLARRDLTINAMAQSDEGVIVDPYGGQVDLANKVLRHVRTESFVEDPVRVLRLARFAARYTEFTVAPETMALCRRMVSAGELHHLVAERVWQELAKGLMESQPSRMLSILQACGALAVILPEVAKLAGTPQPRQWHPEIDSLVHVKMVLDCAAKQGASLEVRFACLVHDLGKALTPVENWPAHHDHEELGIPVVEAVAKRLRVPASCRELAVMVCREHTRVHQMQVLKATSIAHLLQRIDAYRRPARVEELIQACECDARGRLGFENRAYPQAMVLRSAHAAARAVAVGEIAKACKNPAHIPERIHGARSHAIKAVLAEIKSTGDNNLV